MIELDPNNPDAYKNRGVAYMKLSQYDPAIQDFEKTRQMVPDLKGLHSNLGVAWYYKGEYEEAISNYDKEIALSPDSHYAYFNRAICWAELKNYDKSLADISQTLALEPDFYLAYCLKGDLSLELGDAETARAAYEKAVKVDSEADYARSQLETLGRHLRSEKRRSSRNPGKPPFRTRHPGNHLLDNRRCPQLSKQKNPNQNKPGNRP